MENKVEKTIANKNNKILMSSFGANNISIVLPLKLIILNINNAVNTAIYNPPTIMITELLGKSLALKKYLEITKGVIAIKAINRKK